jgi:hypothetical protein
MAKALPRPEDPPVLIDERAFVWRDVWRGSVEGSPGCVLEEGLCHERGATALELSPAAPILISEFRDLLDVAVTTARTLGCAKPWFRGQTRFDWKLLPSARRCQSVETESSQNFLFQMKAFSRHHRCPSLENAHEWLTLMQHYGLPTRLLDWTESMLVAAYFAVELGDDSDAVIWALNPFTLNSERLKKDAIPSLAHPDVVSLVRAAFGAKDCDDCVIACHSPEVDLRMLVQSGAYTIHGGSTAMDEMPQAQPFLVKYRVASSARRRLRQALQLMNITRSSLFPDLGNLAAEMRVNFGGK